MIGNIYLGSIAIEKADLEARQKEVEGAHHTDQDAARPNDPTLEQQHNLVEQFTRWMADISKQTL